MSMLSGRGKRTLRIVAGIVAVVLAYTLYQGWSIHHFGFSDDGRHADCAIVLGAAAWHNKPSPVFQERINHAIALYRDKRVPRLILTGGFGEGAPFAESAIAIETNSQTTLENLVEARKLLDDGSPRTALIVSDPWHLKRAVAMARSVGIDAFPSGTLSSRFESPEARLQFLVRELYFYHRFLLRGQ